MSSSKDAAQRTFALIAGIENYAEPLTTLNGAVKSALEFRDWVSSCKVPKANILLHLSPRKGKARPATWEEFVASKKILKDAQADTLLIYWAGHGDIKKRNRRLYTEDSGTLEQVADFNSMFDVLSSKLMPFKTVFAFVDACASPTPNKYKQLEFAEDDLYPGAAQYVFFASSLGQEANYEDSGGLFSAELFKWLKKKRLPLDPNDVDKVLRSKFRELELRDQRPVSLWMKGIGPELVVDADEQIALQYSLSIRKEWEDLAQNGLGIVPLAPQPGKISEEPKFLRLQLDALSRQFSETTAPAAPDETAKRVDPLEFLANFKHAVLLGDPGSGKTTLLRAMHERFLAPDGEMLPDTLRKHVPLFLDLSRWDLDIETLDDYIRAEASRLGATEFAAEWTLLKKKRKFALIFDGLDRMPRRPQFDPEDRTSRQPETDKRIKAIRSAADQSVCILSCRLREFDGSPAWRDLHLLPLSDAEIRQFTKMAEFGEETSLAFFDWLTKGTLLGRRLRELAGTPYWLMRLLSFFYGSVAGKWKLSTGFLLLHSLGDMLENLRYGKKLSTDEIKNLQRKLSNLAFHMTSAKLLRAEKEDGEEARVWMFRDDPIEWIQEALQPKLELSAKSRPEAERLLALAREAGVLLAQRDAIEFEHQLTQECFSVLYCMSRGVNEKLLANAAQRQFLQVWRLWAQQEPQIVDNVIAFLYPAWGDLTMAHAAEVLGMLGDPRAVEPLLPLLAYPHGDFVLRTAVASALGQLGDRRAVAALLDVLRNAKETDTVRRQAAYAVGLIGDPAAVDTLVGLLNVDQDVAVEAAHALGRIGDPRAIGPLVELLRKNDSEMTLAASNALIWIGKPAAGAILPVLKQVAAGIGFQDGLRALVELGGVNSTLLNFLARKHKKDASASKLIAQTVTQHRTAEERKMRKPPHRGK